MRAIKNCNLAYPVVRHFQSLHNSDQQGLRFCVIQRIVSFKHGGNRIPTLRERESKFIIDWDTMCPAGLNQDEEMYTHLSQWLLLHQISLNETLLFPVDALRSMLYDVIYGCFLICLGTSGSFHDLLLTDSLLVTNLWPQ